MSQHMEALERANLVRLGRCQIKREIANREITAVDVLIGKPDVCNTMSLMELLCAQPRWARKRTLKLLGTVPIREDRTLGALTDRQRNAVVQRLRENGITGIYD